MRLAQIKRRLENLQCFAYKDVVTLPKFQTVVCIYQAPRNYSAKIFKGNLGVGDVWANPGETAFLTFQGDYKQESQYFDFVLNGEGCLFVDGKPYAGLDNNHRYLPIPEGWHDYQIEVYNLYDKPQIIGRAHLVKLNDNIATLTLLGLEAVKLAENANILIAKEMEQIFSNALEQFPPNVSVDKAEEIAADVLAKVKLALSKYNNNKLPGELTLIPQSHIDLAWLWPEKETIRKISRTFSTALRLGEIYDEFIFHQSQPQLFAQAKEYYPELYKDVQKAIKDGKIELVGGMWVEPDCNIPAGESLVRQLLYGKKFYQEEFGYVPEVEWLPDVFGFSPSLPQLLLDADTKAFMTIKTGWNDTNSMPDSVFNWRGIDGSEIPVFMPRTLNEDVDVPSVLKAMEVAQRSTTVLEVAQLIGFGDGGGGVTLSQMEKGRLLASLPALPEVKFGSVKGYVKENIISKPIKNTWDGELYLELHRGTLTTQAKNKKWNRHLEFAARDSEILASFAHELGAEYPTQKINKAWQLILKNQMHDILPGSSITEVYADSKKDYLEVDHLLSDVKLAASRYLAKQVRVKKDVLKSYVVYNTLAFTRTVFIKIEEVPEDSHFIDSQGRLLTSQELIDGASLVEVTLPMMGYTTIYAVRSKVSFNNPFKISETELSNGLVSVVIGDKGSISEVIDLKTAETIIKNTEHHLQFFDDRPLRWDAWEIDPDYEEKQWGPDALVSITKKEEGPLCASLELTWTMNKSTIRQELILYRNSTRIDFHTYVDWRENHVLFKTGFETTIRSRYATYDVAFGNYKRPTFRNTSWERARFEVAAQKWADIADAAHGVSLLNNCKYGYDITGSRIRLSLLRSPQYPAPDADRGEHSFIYSLFLHRDNSLAETNKEAYNLNLEPVIVEVDNLEKEGFLPEEKSFITYKGQGILLDTIKLAEDRDGYILRFFEARGGSDSLRITAGVKQLIPVNLLERAKHTNKESALQFRPFQVKSFRTDSLLEK